MDEDENLYVSDEAKHNVTIMDKDGKVLDTWGEHGSDEGQLDRPSSMQFDSDGNVVISDTMKPPYPEVYQGRHSPPRPSTTVGAAPRVS